MSEPKEQGSGDSGIELMSGNISKLATALAVAQGQMTGASKDGNNPHYGKTYATLNSVVEAIRKPFSDNGLSYVQLPYNNQNRIGVKTILLHNSGEWISSTMEMPVLKADPQGFGSALTYCRRYTLMAIAGIAPEDDDGQDASYMSSSANKHTEAVSAQADFEREKGITATTSIETAGEKAKRELAEKKSAKLAKCPQEFKDYCKAQRIPLGKIFEIMAANDDDPVRLSAFAIEKMKGQSMREAAESIMKGDEGMPA